MDWGEAGMALLLPPILHLHVCIHVSNNNNIIIIFTFHYWHDETRATNITILCYCASKQSIKFHTLIGNQEV